MRQIYDECSVSFCISICLYDGTQIWMYLPAGSSNLAAKIHTLSDKHSEVYPAMSSYLHETGIAIKVGARRLASEYFIKLTVRY